MREEPTRSLLLLDANPEERRLISAIAGRAGWSVVGAADEEMALALLQGPHGREVLAALLGGWDAEKGPQLITSLRERTSSLMAPKVSRLQSGPPSGARAWMCTMAAPASAARRASSPISDGVYGIAGQRSRLASTPVRAALMTQGRPGVIRECCRACARGGRDPCPRLARGPARSPAGSRRDRSRHRSWPTPPRCRG